MIPLAEWLAFCVDTRVLVNQVVCLIPLIMTISLLLGDIFNIVYLVMMHE